MQYAAAYRFNRNRLWNTESSAFADDDSRGCGVFAGHVRLGFEFQTARPSLLASAPRNDVVTPGHAFAISRRLSPEVCYRSFTLLIEGAGKAGCALHPRSRVQCSGRGAHEHTGPAEAIRLSLRDGLGLIRGLLGEPCTFATVARALGANLTPASGCRNPTTSPSAS